MTRTELIDRLAKRFPTLTVQDAELVVRTILAEMTASLSQGGRIEIRGFGSFDLKYRPPRVGRNPKSGNAVEVPGKYVPHFKAGKELREKVNPRESTIERAARLLEESRIA